MTSPQLTYATKIVKQAGERDRLYQRCFYLKPTKRSRWSKATRFSKSVVTIGSSRENGYEIKDPSVSRHHARIEVTGNLLTITDLDSTNGSFVNGVRIKEVFLPDEAIIRLGELELNFRVGKESDELTLSQNDQFGAFLGTSVVARHLFAQLTAFSRSNVTVLLEGESGTGKELLARAIHDQSDRSKAPFITVDCGALPHGLFESELFGHEKGAFTGAISQRAGAFEVAQGGTIFLDEIGELDLALQPKLLRVLEQRKLKRVGGEQEIEVDVRIVCATNRDLHRQMATGEFREDLFYRIAVAHVQVPSLRDRRDDIPQIARVLLDEFHAEYPEIPSFGLSADAIDDLQNRHWRGNVRELRNTLELAFLTTKLDPTSAEGTADVFVPLSEVPTNMSYQRARDFIGTRFEQTYIRAALEKHQGNVAKTARACDMDRATLFRLIKKHGIQRK